MALAEWTRKVAPLRPNTSIACTPDSAVAEPEIYCPECEWRPQAEDRWSCVPSCGTVWNTFWTRGVCPGCGYRWSKTQCLECHQVSRHEDWYHYPEGEEPKARDVERETAA